MSAPPTRSTPNYSDTELRLLTAYKEHLLGEEKRNITPFTNDSVIRYHDRVDAHDVPDIHREVRSRIEEILEEIHKGSPSQVVILAGEPGMGKSHLINHFRNPRFAKEKGYVLVCNSNSWKVDEFEECLLVWLVEVLCTSTEESRSLLEQKVEEIAFQALGQILTTPGHISRFRSNRRTGFLRRIRRLFGNDHDEFQQAFDERNAKIFRKLDFDRFSDYVCDRFLAESGNPFHRYLLKVLLRYLFPEEREQVIHWLRGNPVGNHFLARLQAHEEIDRHYKVFDAVKVLVSLFTGDVARGLHEGGGPPPRGTVFFFAFDQAEGRDTLFEDDSDWSRFFAQLSELYNALPNVFVLFTMTLGLRNKLHPKMEKQFKDRIRNDHRFVMRAIDAEEVRSLYRQRVSSWLSSIPETRALWQEADNPYLPFSREKLVELSRNRSVRATIDVFDEQFRCELESLAIKVPLDFSVTLNEFRAEEEYENPKRYASNHLQTVELLLDVVGNSFAEEYAIKFAGSSWKETEDGLQVLQLEFRDRGDDRRWVRIFLTQLGHFYRDKLEGSIRLLANRRQASYQLWLVRCGPINIDEETMRGREAQVRTQELTSETEAICGSVARLWKRGDPDCSDLENDDADSPALYDADNWEQGKPFLLERLQETYLHDLFDSARRLLHDSDTDAPPEEEEGLRSIERPEIHDEDTDGE